MWIDGMGAITQTEQDAITPRVLADDILLIAAGNGHLGTIVKGIEATFQYLNDIGAKAAPAKSYAFSSSATAREWLRTHKWKAINATIETIIHCRDLGSHINTGNKMMGATLTARMQQAKQVATRIGTLPIDTAKKVNAIRLKVR